MDYAVIKRIGCGTFGSIYLVRGKDGSNSVLKKIPLLKLSKYEIKEAKQEVYILSGLNHPNIVSYKESCELDGFLYIVMNYCGGGDLFTAIKNRNTSIFSEIQIVRWFIQIVMALQYLHQRKILHRDLKTKNIFLTGSGLIKVGDFGISRILSSTLDMASTFVGTPMYMSPEIFEEIPYNHKCDMWSLGCCLYEMITLKQAFKTSRVSSLIAMINKGADISKIPSCYSDELVHIVSSLLQSSPYLRPSAADVLTMPYIKTHMSTFLSNAKKVQTSPSSLNGNLYHDISTDSQSNSTTMSETLCSDDVIYGTGEDRGEGLSDNTEYRSVYESDFHNEAFITASNIVECSNIDKLDQFESNDSVFDESVVIVDSEYTNNGDSFIDYDDSQVSHPSMPCLTEEQKCFNTNKSESIASCDISDDLLSNERYFSSHSKDSPLADNSNFDISSQYESTGEFESFDKFEEKLDDLLIELDDAIGHNLSSEVKNELLAKRPWQERKRRLETKIGRERYLKHSLLILSLKLCYELLHYNRLT